MSRLFTFGCSFTSWPWPTWADIIAYDLAIPHENWGLAGLGNVGIHARLIECDMRNAFTQDDIILVVWSSWSREDRYNVTKSRHNLGWSMTGDVLHSYDKEFIDSYWSINNDLMKNSTAIISANKMFDVRFNGHMSTPLVNLHTDASLSFSENEKEVALFFEPHIPNDGEYQQNTKHKCRYTNINDCHPDILSHLDYVQEYLAPKLGRTLNEKTVDFFIGMHYHLVDFTNNFVNSQQKFTNATPSTHWAKLAPTVLEAYGWTNARQKLRGF
jgi:hypothetical protein